MKIPFTNLELSLRRPAKPSATAPRHRPVTASQIHKSVSRAYAVAVTDRLTADWGVSATSANAEIQQSAPNVRSRNRQLERDNDYFRRGLRLLENNVIGHRGVKLQMKVRDLVGADEHGQPKYRSDGLANAMIEEAWLKYLKPENCTVMRNLSGVDLQRLMVRRLAPDGGLLLRKHRGFANDFRYAVEPLEIDRIDFNYTTVSPVNGNDVIFGMELDAFNAVVAYWILTRHPGDIFLAQRGAKQFRERVPARDIFFIPAGIERAGQSYPMPIWCSVAARLNQLGRYEEAIQVASRMAACKGGFVKETSPPNTEFQTKPTDSQGNLVEEVEPGMIQTLELNQDFVAYDPKFPMNESSPYIKDQIRGASSGMNLSSHAIGNDLSDVNYSSIRAGALEDREEFKTLQTRIIEYGLQPWFEDWLPYAMMSGQIRLPLAKLAKFNAASWCPRRWDWVNPQDDVKAAKEAVAARFKSRQDVIEEGGGDMEEVDAQFEADPHLKDLPVIQAYLNNYTEPVQPQGSGGSPAKTPPL